MEKKRRICSFGSFNPEGARYWVIKKGLQENNYEFVICNSNKKNTLLKYADLWQQWQKIKNQVDVLYVPFMGHYLVPLAWFLARLKRIPFIFDVFISLYDTNVCDRKTVKPRHPKAWFLWGLDFLSCHLADLVLIDTEPHRQYFIKRYNLKPEKILALPVGARTDILYPPETLRKTGGGSYIAEFHGTFIPLQGISTILKAAKIIQEKDKSIIFKIIGKGQTWEQMKKLAESLGLKNINFYNPVPLPNLRDFICEADVCLGIFGTTEKALRVIPHKAYDTWACKKPLITGDTPAFRELKKEKNCAYLCQTGDEAALAAAVLKLKNNPALAGEIAENGYRLMQEKYQPEKIVEPLVSCLKISFSI